jgi:hypothetical protein
MPRTDNTNPNDAQTREFSEPDLRDASGPQAGTS